MSSTPGGRDEGAGHGQGGWQGDATADPESRQAQAGPGWGGSPPPGAWDEAPQGYAHAPAREHAPGAVASLVLGILGLFTIPLVLSIGAVVLGNQSKRAAAAEPHRYHDQLGQVGRILGWIGIGLAALGILFLLAVLAFVFPLRT